MNPSQFDQARRAFHNSTPQQMRDQFSRFDSMSDAEIETMLRSQGMSHISPQMMRSQMKMFQGMDQKQIDNMKSAMDHVDPRDVLKHNYEKRDAYEKAKNQGYVADPRLEYLEKKKDQANGMFKQKEFTKASEGYLGVINDIMSESTEFKQRKEVQNLRKACHLNIAQCRLEKQEFDDARDHAQRVLRYDPQNVKAYFRASKAYRGLKKTEDAVAYGKRALQLSQNDKTIAEYVAGLEQEVKDQKKVEEIERRIKTKEATALEKKKEEEIKLQAQEEESKQEVKEAPARQAGEGGANPMMNPEMAQKMMQNMSAEDLQHQCDMMKQMPPQQIQEMARSQGQEMSLEQVKMMQSMLTPEMMKNMNKMKPQGGMPANMDKMGWKDMLRNPDMMKAGMEMMKGMDDSHPMKKMMQRMGAGANGEMDMEKLMKTAEMVTNFVDKFSKTKKVCCSTTMKLGWLALVIGGVYYFFFEQAI